ncbi:hypothetical protein GCG54_00003233 [Colletotrichum gloeosporioides]|uniref:Uncharacterized protein n=1 Tax=Colletotrichum gloeosporioides TaxID=474922 RepID=A0A8H4FHN0_COLGL|nr:uncharacterized protein GCG54_00003233 [Colletotrichum gloeosporioides]KAF3802430.1 hypothetical protein GCG54_00003233 [Colletotrichum gloeosporioides]
MLDLHAALRRQAKTTGQAFTFTSRQWFAECHRDAYPDGRSMWYNDVLVSQHRRPSHGTSWCWSRDIESLVPKAAVLTELGCWLAMGWRGTIPNGVGGASTV